MSAYTLKYLQPSQYDSWLRKVDDPDWFEHRYRDQKDHAMASAVRELRDVLSQRNELLEALKEICSYRMTLLDDSDNPPDGEDLRYFVEKLWVMWQKADAAIAKAGGK